MASEEVILTSLGMTWVALGVMYHKLGKIEAILTYGFKTKREK